MAVEKKKKVAKKDEPTPTVETVFTEEAHEDVDDTAEAVENTTEEEDEEEKHTTAEEEPSMPMSAVEGLLKRMEERISNQFNSKLQKLKLGQVKEGVGDDAAYIAELEEDWLEIPVVFFAYSINFSIHGDNNRGKSTKPPHGAVRFKPIIRAKRKRGKHEEVISVSSIKINSSSVVEYLRGHSQFGIAFFENMDSVLNMDSGWAQKLIEANQSIQKLSDQQIIARSRQQDLPIGTDIISMRKALVEKMAKISIAKQHQISYGKLEKANIEVGASGSEREIVERTIN
jgi:hypothetical protein